MTPEAARSLAQELLSRKATQDLAPDTAVQGAWSAYADPIFQVMLLRTQAILEPLLAGRLHPTYSYARVYVKGCGLPPHVAETHIHDVLNVFMCTGFTRETGQYFMKASPVRPGDYLEFFAEIDLLASLSACPGGDCATEHSSDATQCHPLLVETFKPANPPKNWQSPVSSAYSRSHGL